MSSPLPVIEVRDPRKADDPPLWNAEGPDRDRFLARVVGGAEAGRTRSGDGDPPVFDRDDPELGERLAELVERRVIPGWRPC